jgi:hypothetical protein
MKKFAAITLMLITISCHSGQREPPAPQPTLQEYHAAGVKQLRSSPTMEDLIVLETDLRNLRKLIRVDGGKKDEMEIMRGEAVLAAHDREDELCAARIAEIRACLLKIAELENLQRSGADTRKIVDGLRLCRGCADDHQTEDFLLRTEGDADAIRRAVDSAIRRLSPSAG